jgi:hypothetical protein
VTVTVRTKPVIVSRDVTGVGVQVEEDSISLVVEEIEGVLVVGGILDVVEVDDGVV